MNTDSVVNHKARLEWSLVGAIFTLSLIIVSLKHSMCRRDGDCEWWLQVGHGRDHELL
jgi:hypothetical protein